MMNMCTFMLLQQWYTTSLHLQHLGSGQSSQRYLLKRISVGVKPHAPSWSICDPHSQQKKKNQFSFPPLHYCWANTKLQGISCYSIWCQLAYANLAKSLGFSWYIHKGLLCLHSTYFSPHSCILELWFSVFHCTLTLSVRTQFSPCSLFRRSEFETASTTSLSK